MLRFSTAALTAGLLSATAAMAAAPAPDHAAYASTYQAIPSAPVLIQGATVLIGNGERLEAADVLLQDGKVLAVGVGLTAPSDALRVDAKGKWVTPGLIDVHSHLGVYPSPGMSAHSDGNEMTNAVTAHVWAEHSVWPQDPGFAAALAGGVTALQILPGSANLVGGRGVTLKNMPATSVQAMKFPQAPWGLKMACGENPKRVYASRGGPATRMGNMAGYRAAFIEAQDYLKKQSTKDDAAGSAKSGKRSRKSRDDAAKPGDSGKRDLRLETLAGVLSGDIKVHIHCYRADEMINMLDLAKEFDFKIAAFHHGVEAYKIADRLAEEGVCGALWADWWGFKMEALDGIQENIALVDRPAKSCAILHSDSDEGIQRLNQEAAKVMAHAELVGIDIAPERAIRWLTENAAKSLGILEQTGTLQAGKMADVVLWNGNPFSVYAQAEQVWIDGARMYDRHDRARQPVSDFMLGQDFTRGGAR